MFVNDLQELLEAREQECVKLRRELKELRNTVSLRRLLTQGEIQLRSQFAPESADVKMWSRRDGQTGLPLICPLVRSIFFYISVVLNQHCCSRAVTCCFFLCSVPPSPLTAETSSCPTQQKPATVTGLLECRKRDEAKLIKNLITGETELSPTFTSLCYST